MNDRFDPLFRPDTVAVIGASANPSKIGNVVLRNLLCGPFKVYPVNPREESILGIKCYHSLADVPGKIDLALVILPRDQALKAAEDCIAREVRYVIVMASGFSETGQEGKVLQEDMARSFKRSGSRLLGPNTMGLFVPGHKLDTFLIPIDRSPRPPEGSIAMISQSGAIAISFLERAASFGAGISACICIGNKADIDENELLAHFSEDPGTDCVALYLESFSNGRGFLEVARELAIKKPVVVLKSGRTASGAQAACSHTGAIAGTSDALVLGAMRQAGVLRVFDEEELVDVARALSSYGSIRGDRICVVASAGGYGVIATDFIESQDAGYGLKMAELSVQTRERLASVMPAFSSFRNPVDLTAEVSDRMYDQVLQILQSDPGIDCILMSLELQPPNITKDLVDVAAGLARSEVPIVVSVSGVQSRHGALEALEKNRVPYYPTIRRAVRSIAALAESGRRANK